MTVTTDLITARALSALLPGGALPESGSCAAETVIRLCSLKASAIRREFEEAAVHFGLRTDGTLDAFSCLRLCLVFSGFERHADALREYHVMHFNSGVLNSAEARAELLAKKGKILLETVYGCDPIAFATGLKRLELAKPFVDTVVDVQFPVRTVTALSRESRFLGVVQNILTRLGYPELSCQLKGYHLAKPSGAYDEETRSAVLVRRFDEMLPKYGGDTVEMLRSFTQDEFNQPLEDILVEPRSGRSRKVSIETSTVTQLYGGDRWSMIQAYLSEKKLHPIQETLRRYHLRDVPDGVYGTAEGIEFLVRHMAAIRKAPPYNGNLSKFTRLVSLAELERPFSDVIGETAVTVPTLALTRHHGSSPTAMVERYLSAQRVRKLRTRFRPEHRKKARSGLHQDEDAVRRILFDKLDHLLEHSFNGDMERLRRGLTDSMIRRAYRTPLTARESIRITPATAWRAWGGSFDELLEQYERSRHAAEAARTA